MSPLPDFLDHEPPLAVLDAIYDDFVRVRVAPRALAMARDWLGAADLQLVEPGDDAPCREDGLVSRPVAMEGEDAEMAPVLVSNWRTQSPPTADQMGRFSALARHVARARTYRGQLVETRRLGEVFNSGLGRLSIGVITVFPDGRPIAANRLACDLLDEADGISLIGGRLCLASPAEQKALRKLLDMTIGGTVEQGGLRVTRPSGKADLNLLVLRPPPRPGVIRSGLRILLRDPEHRTVHSRNALRDLHGLTDTEAAITMHLANGLSSEEVEERFAIRHNTMRAHLRSIYAKLGVCSHAELVYAILTGASALALENHDELPPLEPLTSLVQ
ncbi:MAG: helix-turn-helix transcriptional regulator [Novosphingobium sp.]|nr:helix-turn-helix transcriptional regulator [Novosphingobium sp.]